MHKRIAEVQYQVKYEDFIEGIRPVTRPDGTLEYRRCPGLFVEFCAEAEKRKDACVLIIDEVNRANLAKVFGELMYLLEYRDGEIRLAGGTPFRIPGNVRILGTMNTADRSIALVDHALRRRFAFIALDPNYEALSAIHDGKAFPVDRLTDLLKEINGKIKDPHFEIGISYFTVNDLDVKFEDIWRMEIEPYLEEFFFDRRDLVEQYRYDAIESRLFTESNG